MNGSVVRTKDEASRMWRVRTWPNDPTVAHLVFVDHLSLPTLDSVNAAVEQARRSGARAVRTSALYPRVAEVLCTAGFEPIDRLLLLRRDLDPEVVAQADAVQRRLHPLRSWQAARAAKVDQDAFGLMWGNDASSLREICRATPHNRSRLIRDGRTIAGFAISGAALDNGYLQRLSVAGAYRRQHVARDLVLDALRWMYARGLNAAFVNTGTDNKAALTLYEGLGFEQLNDELVIAERALSG